MDFADSDDWDPTLHVSKAKTAFAKQSCCIQTQMYRLYKKWPWMVIFLFNLDTFVWMKHF